MELIPVFFGISFATVLHAVSRRLPMWAYIVVSLPGTLLHELCHWLFAFILRARPALPSIIPRKEGGVWCLGSVAFHAKWYSASIISLAPLIVLLLGGMLLLSPDLFLELQAKHQFKVIAAALWFGPALLPSRADWLIALEYPVPLLLLAALTTLFLF